MVVNVERPAPSVEQDTIAVVERILGVDWRGRINNDLLNIGYTRATLPNFRKSPERHIYPDGRRSQSINLIEEEIDDDVVIVSLLPPNSKSTPHYHDGIEEVYTVLEGEANIHGHGDVQASDVVVIPSETAHQVVTHDDFMLLHIVMRGAAAILSTQRHLNVRNLYSATEARNRAIGEGFPEANLRGAA